MFQGRIVAQGEAPDARPLEFAVIIPTRNEAANVDMLLAKLEEALSSLSWEAIFVDDDSPDGTAEHVRAIARRDRRVRVVHRVGRRGLSSAVLEGMLATAAPVLAVIDGDLQHDEALLPRLYAAVAGGRDLAVATRYGDGGGTGDWMAGRVRVSRIATRVAAILTPTPLSDPMSGFFAVSRDVVMAALPRLSGGGFKILLDLAASSPRRLDIVELPYVFRPRLAGSSKLDLMAGAEYAKLLLDKTVGRLLPTRLLLFLAVGALGLVVHLGVLGLLTAIGIGFASAQAAAVATAIAFNFNLNNLFTYADRRLTGRRYLTGLAGFYAVCLVGAVANVGIGTWVHEASYTWWAAGVAGAIVGAVWNFAASSVVTWRR